MQPIYTLREDRIPGVTPTWREWYEDRVVDEWIMSVASVLDQGWNDQYVICTEALFLPLNILRAAAQRGARQYEFPTGYNNLFGPERFFIGEQFYTHSPHMMVRVTLIDTSTAFFNA